MLHRDAILREMGLAPIWRLRRAGAETDVVTTDRDDASTSATTPPPAVVESVAPAAARAPEAGNGREPGPGGVRRAAPRPIVPVAREESPASPAPHEVTHDPERVRRIGSLDWTELEETIRACRACRLCEKRKQAVPGVGNRRAEWMFVGEGPGAEEDQRGEPFVGAAGHLLDAMLGAIGLERTKDVYIANAVKCRPPHNRTPQGDEIQTCGPFLARQIALVKPRVIVALGRPAALALIGQELAIGASRGKVFDVAGTSVVVTYHPAYLLRNPADKAKAWEDLCFARRVMRDAAPR